MDPACNVGTVSGTKTSESGSAFTSPGAVISTSPGASSSPATDSSYSFSVTPGTYSVISTVPTGYSVRGSVNGAAYSVTSTVSVSVGQGATVNVSWKYNPVTKLVVSGSSTVGACGSNSVTVVAQDAFGNQALGYRGTVHLTSSDPAAVLPADHTFAAIDNGTFTFQSVVLKTAGTQSITATDTAFSTISGTLSSITVSPGAAASLALTGPAGTTAGDPFSLLVEARDSCQSNRVTTYSGTVHFTSTDANATLPPDYQFVTVDAGRHSFSGATFKTAGSQSLTANDTATPTITSPATGILVVPGPATRFIVSGVNSPTTAGIGSTVIVEAKDAFANRATGYTGTMGFATSDAQAALPGQHAFTSSDAGLYSASVTLRTAGSQFVSATDLASPAITGSQSGIVVDAASATRLTISGLPATVTAGDTHSATVTGFDPYDNVATGYRGTVHFSSSDPLATTPPDRAFLPADLGQATVSAFVLKTSGSQNFSVSDTLTPAMSGSQTVLVLGGPAVSLSVSGFPASISAGVAGTLTVTARDSFGNVSESYLGTVTFSSSDSKAALPATSTFAASDAGTKTFTATLKTAGAQSIFVSDGSLPTVQSNTTVTTAAPAVLLISGITSPRAPGEPSSVNVEVRDGFGNRVVTYLGTVQFSSSDPAATLPAPVTFASSDQGYVTVPGVVLRSAGSQSVSATDGMISGVQTAIIIDATAPTWPPGSALTGTSQTATSVTLTWTPANDDTAVAYYRVYENGVVLATTPANVLSANVSGLTTGSSYVFAVQAGDAVGNWSVDGPMLNFVATVPDPVLTAPPIDESVPSPIAAVTRFLYTGNNPVQLDVAPDAIDDARVAVVRGHVIDRNGNPVAAVAIGILGHPEYGNTYTRADGWFDLVVNGGSILTVSYSKDGFLPVQRSVSPRFGEYAVVDEIALSGFDQLVTAVDVSGSSPVIQVAQGSVQSDVDGARRATVLVLPGTTATLVKPSGTTPVQSLRIRATEYTVGSAGPKAMPGALPPASAYTYAVALTADEAVAANATSVSFSKAPILYVENFVGLDTGVPMPTGYYNRDVGNWLDSDNGLVIKILSIASGTASIDVDGSGTPASPQTLSNLGVSNAELAVLARLYVAGQSLWRSPIPHFSDWDSNMGFAPQPDATTGPEQDDDSDNNDPCLEFMSVIECENRVLRETISLPGAGASLVYSSDRVPGRAKAYRHLIHVTGPTVPSSLQSISLRIAVAGRSWQLSFPPTPNQDYVFTWDGLDAYGRKLQGEQILKTSVGYVYPISYTRAPRFGYNGNGVRITGSRTLSTLTLWGQSGSEWWTGYTGSLDARRAEGFGGWTLSNHHSLSSTGGTLYFGDGSKRRLKSADGSVNPVPGPVVHTVALTANGGFSGGGGAFDIDKNDGSIYFLDTTPTILNLRRYMPNGTIHTVAGALFSPSTAWSPEGTPAINTILEYTNAIAVQDGYVYYPERNGPCADGCVRRLRDGGVVETVAGLNPCPFHCNEIGIIPALNAHLVANTAFIRVSNGNVYVHNSGSFYRFVPGGGVETVVGRLFDPVSLTSTVIGTTLIAAGPFTLDGELCWGENTIVRCGTSGRTVAGTGTAPANDNWIDGPALSRAIFVRDITRGPDGSLYMTTGPSGAPSHCVVRLDSDGWLRAYVGCGTKPFVEGIAAADVNLVSVGSIRFGPDRRLYLNMAGAIRRVDPVTSDALVQPSPDGRQAHVFDPVTGRHLRTVDATTNRVVASFAYDPAGRLSAFTDGDNRTTFIHRDTSGVATDIETPDNQFIQLGFDAQGWLSSVTDPARVAVRPNHAANGLLGALFDRRGLEHDFLYDAAGNLIRDTDPAGGFKRLANSDSAGVHAVSVTTAMGLVSQHAISASPAGTSRSHIDAAGLNITTTERSSNRTMTGPDGTVTSEVDTADPRFGMLAPVTSTTITLPSGLKYQTSETRAATLSIPSDPTSLRQESRTVSVNGRRFSTSYDAASRILTATSPLGRVTTTTLDVAGRVTQVQEPGVVPFSFQYFPNGRLSTVTEGTRQFGFSFDSNGYLSSIHDPLGRVKSFFNDPIGRPLRSVLTDSNEIDAAFDNAGNVNSLVPPARPTHQFTYTPVNLQSDYIAPDTGQPRTLHIDYDVDGRVSTVSRPDGEFIIPSYDPANGRLLSFATSRGSVSLGYSSSTGQIASMTTFDGAGLLFGYDGFLLNSVAWSGPIVGVLQRTYDANLRVSIEVTNGTSINYTYDNDDLLTSAGALAIARDSATGFVTGTTLGTITDSRTYNSYGEEQTYTVRIGGASLYSVDYGTRDELGRIVTKTETIQSATTSSVYSYDIRGRLRDVAKSGATAHYEYDPNGNRTVAPGLSALAQHDDQDRVLAYGACTYSYSADGALSRKSCPDGRTTYDYDAFGNLRKVALPTKVIDYVIDAQNRRIGKRVNGALLEGFIYRGQFQPAAWLNADGSVKATFVYGLRPNVPEYMIQGTSTFRIITDQVGTVRLVINASTGAVVQRVDWDEFGNILADTAPGTQPFGFAGGLYDPDTGLTRFGARDYDSITGRWTAKDPVGFGGGLSNLYSYVGNDPVNWKDPSGFSDEWPDTSGPPGMPWDPLPCTCPLVPTHPAAVSCPANMREAGRHLNPFWFYNRVNDYGPWDYKRVGPHGYYEKFGNFNYGATGAAMGWPPQILLRMAGWAQRRKKENSKPEWGTPWDLNLHGPYGDDPKDQVMIRAGIQYSQCGCGL